VGLLVTEYGVCGICGSIGSEVFAMAFDGFYNSWLRRDMSMGGSENRPDPR
jgi:hypothetical protein